MRCRAAVNAFAKSAYVGGLADVRTAVAMMSYGRKMIHTTRLIRESHQERYGLTGTNRENRRTGAVEGISIQHHTVNITSGMKAKPLKSALERMCRYSRMDICDAR